MIIFLPLALLRTVATDSLIVHPESPDEVQIPIGSFDTGMKCIWDGALTDQDRMHKGCGFRCASPWGQYGNYKTWKAQEENGVVPGGSWREALETVHSCGAPHHCCCKPECNVPQLRTESFIGMNWSDKYMRNQLDRVTQFKILRDNDFFHIKLFSPDGLAEISRAYGDVDMETDATPMNKRRSVHAYVGVPNRYLSSLSSNLDDCREFIKKNILEYKSIVKMLIVGNEPLLCIKTKDWATKLECGSLQVPAKLLPAMKNMKIAAMELGLDVPVTTAFNGGIMEMSQNPWTPCVADFKEHVKPILEPIWDFLRGQDPVAPFMVNLYSWFACMGGHLTPAASCGHYEPNQRDEKGEIITTVDANGERVPIPFNVAFDGEYGYLFNYDMQVDMQRVAMCKNGIFDVPLWIGETGWPTAGHKFATYTNSGLYMKNIVKRGRGELIGPAEVDTARWTGVPHTVFLFEAFNEEYKYEIEHGSKFENDFGIFHETGSPKWVKEDGTLDMKR